MEEEKPTTISMVLSLEETERLSKAKKKTGIKNSSDLFRFLLKHYAEGDVL
jgi:hypothetical protein